MLRRMRGEDNDDTPAPPTSNAELNQAADPVVAVDNIRERISADALATGAPETEEVENCEPMKLEELRRASRKPTLSADLTAMRELANSSARRAIAKHHKRRHLDKALGLFVVCLIATGVGGYLLSVGMKAQEFLSPKFLGGSVLVFGGLLGGLKLLSLLLLAVREGSWEKKSPAKKPVEEVGPEGKPDKA